MSAYWKCIAAAASELDLSLVHHITDFVIDSDSLCKTGQGILTTIFESVLDLKGKEDHKKVEFLADLVCCLEDSGFRPFEAKHAWMWLAWDFYPSIKALKDFIWRERVQLRISANESNFDLMMNTACASKTLSGLRCSLAFRLASVPLMDKNFVRKVLKEIVKHGVPGYTDPDDSSRKHVDPAKQVHYYDRVDGDIAQHLFGPMMLHNDPRDEKIRVLNFFRDVLGDKYRDQFLLLVDSTGDFRAWVDQNATDSFKRKKRQAKELLEKKDRAKRRKEEIEDEIERLMDEAEQIEAEFFINDDEEEEESDCESSSSEVF